MRYPPLADHFFSTVSWLGSLALLLPATAALVYLLHRNHKKQEALLLSIGLGLTILIVHVLKLLIKRPRPEVEPLLVPMPASWSFPSAHAAQAAAFFLAAAWIATRLLPKPAAQGSVAACILTALTIGYSRVYLQVHHPSDVLAGLLVGACGVLIALALLPLPIRTKNQPRP